MGNKLMLVINPAAGRGQYKSSLADIIETFSSAGYTVTVYMTEHEGHAAELVGDSAQHYSIVVCCGGDGTLSETMSGLMSLEERPLLGYIPMGTANDVASTLNIPNNAREAAKIITQRNCIPFDVGNMGGHFFTYISAFGAFTQVSYETPHESKQVLGHLAYILESVGHFGSIQPHKTVVEYDGSRLEGEYAFGAVTNTASIAGLVKLKTDYMSLGDGEFEVILIKNPKNIIDLNNIFLGLLAQNYNPDFVTMFKASKVKFTFEEPVRWTRDGEDGGEYSEIILENVHAPISFIVPEGLTRNEPSKLPDSSGK